MNAHRQGSEQSVASGAGTREAMVEFFAAAYHA